MQSTLDALDCDNGDDNGDNQSPNEDENDGASRNAFVVDRFFGGKGGASIESMLRVNARNIITRLMSSYRVNNQSLWLVEWSLDKKCSEITELFRGWEAMRRSITWADPRRGQLKKRSSRGARAEKSSNR